jgi:hypothetical protein
MCAVDLLFCVIGRAVELTCTGILVRPYVSA